MPNQRTNYFRKTCNSPHDFPEWLRLFKVGSGLSWSEIARGIGKYRHTVWRWKEGRGRPNTEYKMALLELEKGWVSPTSSPTEAAPNLKRKEAVYMVDSTLRCLTLCKWQSRVPRTAPASAAPVPASPSAFVVSAVPC